MNKYIIPANSKKSKLILGLFTGVDLAIFVVGVIFAVVLLLVFKTNDVTTTVLLASPALVAALLVAPLPVYYHNVLTLLKNMWQFFTGIKKYYWRGWCASYGSDRPKRGSRTNF